MREEKDDQSDRRGCASYWSEVWSLNLSAWSKAGSGGHALIEVGVGDG